MVLLMTLSLVLLCTTFYQNNQIEENVQKYDENFGNKTYYFMYEALDDTKYYQYLEEDNVDDYKKLLAFNKSLLNEDDFTFVSINSQPIDVYGTNIPDIFLDSYEEGEAKNSVFKIHDKTIQDITIYKNIALPMIYKKYNSKNIKERISYLLNILDIEDKTDKYPYELSGGQCQRVAIARAIAAEPNLLLADEPTGALDENTGNKIMNILKKINQNGTTIILVTHDQEIAKCCNRKFYLKDGKIV